MLYLYTMEIIITHSNGVSVTNNAEHTTRDIIDPKTYKVTHRKGINIANLFHLDDCDPPPLNEEVEVVTDDKIFLCIFVNNVRLDIIKEIEIWQRKEYLENYLQ